MTMMITVMMMVMMMRLGACREMGAASVGGTSGLLGRLPAAPSHRHHHRCHHMYITIVTIVNIVLTFFITAMLCVVYLLWQQAVNKGNSATMVKQIHY